MLGGLTSFCYPVAFRGGMFLFFLVETWHLEKKMLRCGRISQVHLQDVSSIMPGGKEGLTPLSSPSGRSRAFATDLDSNATEKLEDA